MVDSNSFLFITLDSCRYDTFAAAEARNLKAVGPLYRAMAPGSFTFASHAAMFVGFTPGAAERSEPYLNPKYCKIFRMESGVEFGGAAGRGEPFVTLAGRNIVEGWKRRGHVAIGSGAVRWFDPGTETGTSLSADFDHFFYPGRRHALDVQLDWIQQKIRDADGQPVFVFLNVGEMHVPYYYEGAPWPATPSPCVPFGSNNNAEECRRRQTACLEWVDARLAPLLQQFQDASTLVCADHGDAWGEDGLWEHGFSHPAVLEVPLLFRLNRVNT